MNFLREGLALANSDHFYLSGMYFTILPSLSLSIYSNVLALFLFLIRAITAGVFQAVYAYTPEVYPTDVRGSAMGMFAGISRIGAAVTPFVAQVSWRIVCVCACMCSALGLIILRCFNRARPGKIKAYPSLCTKPEGGAAGGTA